MRVAITLEQCWHAVPGGTGVYGIEVASELARLPGLDMLGVAGRHRRPATSGFAPAIPMRVLPIGGPLLYESWLRLGWPRVEAATGPVDVVHATSIIPPATAAPLVVTVHDLAFLHDPSHFTRRGVDVFRRSMELVKRRAARIICVSQATLDDCLRHGFDVEQLRCVENGVRPVAVTPAQVSEVLARHRLPNRYLLFVGTIEPRKNLNRLLEAHAMLGDRIPDLVIAGAAGWGDGITVPASTQGRVHTVGFVPADELAALYSGAIALCYPSIREGFGLPILEAMAQGTPVVTSANGATEEVAGGAAILVDPLDVGSIADGILRVIESRDELSGRARDRATHLSWKRTAQLTREVYAEALAASKEASR